MGQGGARRWRRVACAVCLVLSGIVVGACGAGGDVCAGTALEVKPVEHGVVWQNRVTCTGEVDAEDGCSLRFPARVWAFTKCDALVIHLGAGGPTGASLISLQLDIVDDVVDGASAKVVIGCDDPPCREPPRVISGSVIPDAVSGDPDGRNAGQFSLAFANGTATGTYDTHGLVASRWWVMDSMDVADAPDQAGDLAWDLDYDGIADNRLGRFLAAIPGHQAAADVAVATGRAIQLFGFSESVPLTTQRAVSLYVLPGVDSDVPANPGDDFSGSEEFVLVRGAQDTFAIGDIAAGRFSGSAERVTMRLPLTQHGGVVALPIVRFGVGGTLAERTITQGMVGGAVHRDDIETVLLPALHDSFVASVAADCIGLVCEPGSAGEYILATYDADGDGAISYDEVADNSDIQRALAPDLDVYDSDGNFNPNGDGVLDSVSLGFHFTAVSARAVPQ